MHRRSAVCAVGRQGQRGMPCACGRRSAMHGNIAAAVAIGYWSSTALRMPCHEMKRSVLPAGWGSTALLLYSASLTPGNAMDWAVAAGSGRRSASVSSRASGAAHRATRPSCSSTRPCRPSSRWVACRRRRQVGQGEEGGKAGRARQQVGCMPEEAAGGPGGEGGGARMGQRAAGQQGAAHCAGCAAGVHWEPPGACRPAGGVLRGGAAAAPGDPQAVLKRKTEEAEMARKRIRELQEGQNRSRWALQPGGA